jgi:valyl-tRNA synthetase
MALLEEHGSDGVRYWAASGRPGADTAFDTNQMRVGRRLAIKLLNASRFVLAAAEPQGDITAPVDRAMLRKLAGLVDEATRDLDGYDYARALQHVEEFFWRFCDDYLELVKGRRYQEQGADAAASANAALTAALSVLVRLFAPFLPFVAEEVWSWWHDGSVHLAAWPSRGELESLLAEQSSETLRRDQQAYDWAATVLFEVRKQRSEAKQPLRVPITKATITAAPELVALMPLVEADLKSALRVQAFETSAGQPQRIHVEGYDAS